MRSVLVIVNGVRGWALDRLYSPLAEIPGVTIAYTGPEPIPGLDTYDVVHCTYYHIYIAHTIRPERAVVSLHHVERQHRAELLDALTTAPPTALTAPYPGSFSMAAEAGLAPHFVPYWVGPQAWQRQPKTVGILGMRWPNKRIASIKAAAALAGVPVVDWTREATDVSPATRDLDEFYGQIGCYVNAAFCDAGPMPALDALARGIPVVTTPEGSVPMYLRDGVHGYYTDGTVEDMAGKIRLAFELPIFTPPPMPTLADWIARHKDIYDAA